MSATYEVHSYYASTPSYRITGVGKVRFRDEYLWFWDDDDRVLLVERFYNQGIVERADVDSAAADEDVIEVISGTTPAGTDVVARVPGVTSVTVKFSKMNYNSRCMILKSDDDDLPAALVNPRFYSLRREGAAITALT
jgi:hypothetical protein